MTTGQPQLAPGSVDLVRVIRRSMRCFVLGAIGLVPLFGTGFGYQAVRLGRAVSRDLQRPWEALPVYWYWLAGTIGVALVSRWAGLPGASAICAVLLGIQSWHCWCALRVPPEAVWNPGQRHLAWGVVFAFAGMSLTLWSIVIAVVTLVKALAV